MATGGGMNLGNATFTVTANTAQFQAGMTQAQQQAQGMSTVVVANLKGVQYQLSAINATAMTTTAAVRDLTAQLSTMAMAGARGGGLQQLGGGFQQAGKAANQASLGFLYLSQAIEDAQYGFSAIVNNIPMIVMGFGGSAGLAGAVSIVAVGLNQLIEHWDEFKAKFADTSVFQTVNGALVQVKETLEGLDKQLGNSGNAWSGLLAAIVPAYTALRQLGMPDLFGDAGIDAAMARRKGVREEKALKAAERYQQDEGGDEQQAKDFKEALQKYGGGKKLYDEMFRRRIADMGGEIDPGTGKVKFGGKEDAERERAIRVQTAEQMMRGEGGRLGPGEIERFPLRLQDELRDVQMERSLKEESKKADERRKRIDELNEQGAAVEKETRLGTLRENKEDLQKQFDRERHALTGRQRQQLEDAIIGSKAPQESKIMSTKALVDATMTSGASQMPQKQLDKMVEMNNHLKAIEKEIKSVGRYQ